MKGSNRLSYLHRTLFASVTALAAVLGYDLSFQSPHPAALSGRPKSGMLTLDE